MKPRLVNMLPITKKLIIDNPRALALVEHDRATMRHRISIVFRNHLVKIITRFPLEHTRLRFIPDHKRSINMDRVLFEPIDLHCRMIRSRSKLMPLREISRINIRSRIDYERASTRRDFNTQHIVMPMRSTPINPRITRVETEIQIAVAHD